MKLIFAIVAASITTASATPNDRPVPCREGTLQNAAETQAFIQITLPDEVIIPPSAGFLTFKQKKFKDVKRNKAISTDSCFREVLLIVRKPIPQPVKVSKRQLKASENSNSFTLRYQQDAPSHSRYRAFFHTKDISDSAFGDIEIPVERSGGAVTCTLGDLADLLESNGFETNIGKSDACKNPIEGSKGKKSEGIEELHRPTPSELKEEGKSGA